MTRRHGTGLAEMLVAITLAGVVLAVASRTLVQYVRQTRERDAQARADETVHESLAVMRAELAHAAGEPHLIGDTAVLLASQRAFAGVCDAAAARLSLPASVEWWSQPRAGDSVAVMDTLTGVEWRTAVNSTGTQRANAACPTGGTRLTLVASPPASVPVLRLPVRVWRVVRYVSYRSGDGQWWLGERSCTPVCGAAQPITGPLLAPAQGGLHFALVSGASGHATGLDIHVRAMAVSASSAGAARLPVVASP